MNELITVIVPVYNVEKYLDRCIESIVKQTYKNLEIILVDDGSSDNSPRICDEWAEKDNRIIVIHQVNGGVSKARNTALEMARGDYITFVDSDDYIECEMYHSLYDNITSFDGDVACCGMREVDADQNIIYTHTLKNGSFCDNQVLLEFLNGNFLMCVWNKLYKTETLKANHLLFDENLGYGEDYIFNYHFFKAARSAVSIDKVYHNYLRNRTDSATYSYSEGYFNFWKNTKYVMNHEADNKETYPILLTQYTNDLLTVAKNLSTRKDKEKYTNYYCEVTEEIKNNYPLLMQAENISKVRQFVLKLIRFSPALAKSLISSAYKLKRFI